MGGSGGLSDSGGFTLMELIVITCLLSLFLIFSIPRLQFVVPLDHLNATVRWMMSTVTELKNSAHRDSRVYSLHLDIDHGLMWIAHEDMTEAEIQAARTSGFRLPRNVRILDVEIPNAGKAVSGSAEIVFNSRGYSSKALVHLLGKGGGRASLLVETFMPGASYYDRRIRFDEG